MADWEPVIGLEIHVQLKTRTKMFCGCELSFGDEPNTHTCPVCLGLPGTLPVVNARAIDYGLMMALAFDCEIAPRSIFHRKNYFYPDQAKNYQISQYDIPLCTGGRLGDVRLHRIHLEEDAAKLVHLGESGRIHGSQASIVDYNRGGTPLAEIVTEPDIHSAEQARDWLNLLRVTLRQLGVSDVNMEEGSLRADANVSVRPAGSDELGTKTELKNMNSFRFLMQGVNAEVKRQIGLLEAGEPVVAGDAALRPHERAAELAALQGGGARLPLLPRARPRPGRRRPRRCCTPRARRCPSCPPSAPSATRATGTGGRHRAAAGRRAGAGASSSRRRRPPPRRWSRAPWPTGSPSCARASAPTRSRWSPTSSRRTSPALAQLVAGGKVTTGNARKVLDVLVAEGGEPDEIVEREGLGALEDDGELAGIVARVIGDNPTSSSASRAATPRRWARWSGRS